MLHHHWLQHTDEEQSPVLPHNSFALWLHGTNSLYIKSIFSYYFSYIILAWIWGRWILFIYNSGDSRQMYIGKNYSSWRLSLTLVIQESLSNLKDLQSFSIVILSIKDWTWWLVLILDAVFILCIWLKYIALQRTKKPLPVSGFIFLNCAEKTSKGLGDICFLTCPILLLVLIAHIKS